jgi:hypothetical protein
VLETAAIAAYLAEAGVDSERLILSAHTLLPAKHEQFLQFENCGVIDFKFGCEKGCSRVQKEIMEAPNASFAAGKVPSGPFFGMDRQDALQTLNDSFARDLKEYMQVGGSRGLGTALTEHRRILFVYNSFCGGLGEVWTKCGGGGAGSAPLLALILPR